jgi:hypothetical protein
VCLVLAQRATFVHAGDNDVLLDRGHRQAEQSIIEQHVIARSDVSGQVRIRARNQLGRADNRTSRDAQRLTLDELHRTARRPPGAQA